MPVTACTILVLSSCKNMKNYNVDAICLAKKRANSCLLSMFQNVLYDVVSVLVLEQLFSVGVELLQDGASLFRCAVLKDPLDHSAPVRMG